MIIGHKKVINFLDRQIENDALSQAYIFEGPESVGKKTVAFHLAEKTLGRKIKEADSSVFVLSSQKKEISIEETREFIHKMSFCADEKKTIFIIDDAEKLNKSSQNALLKSIEETGKNKIIILVVKDEKKILPTIFSRCQKIRFGLVGQREIEDAFCEHESKKEIIGFWSQGRPGVARKILENEEEIEKLKESFLNLKTLFQGSLKEKMDLAKVISKNQKNIAYQMEIWIMLVRKTMLGIDKKVSISTKKAFFLIEEILKSLEILKKTNANSRLALEELFLKF